MARQDFKQRVIFELVDKASGPASKISSAIGAIEGKLGAIAAGAVVAKALGSLAKFLDAGAEAAAKAETATVRLGAALANAGPGASAFADQLLRQAEALQKLGSVNAEAVQGVQTLLANIGVGADQIGLATQAAVDLSAALGIGLDAAAVQVGKTINGTIGRLGALVPELAGLSKEALRAGEGIKVLAEQFGGQAATQAVTYANSISRLNEAFEDTSQALGGGLAGAPVAESVRDFAFALEVLNSQVEQSGFSEFLGSIKAGLIELGANLTVGAANLLSFSSATDASSAAQREASAASDAATAAYGREIQAIREREAAQLAATESQKAFVAATSELGVTLESEVNDQLAANNALLLEADSLYRQGVITRRDFEAVELAIVEADRKLKLELAGTAASLDAVGTEFGSATQAATQYQTQVDQLTAASNRATAATYGLGNALGVVARSSGSQALVDASVAAGNRPFLGGTRIRVPGGSRLVGR